MYCYACRQKMVKSPSEMPIYVKGHKINIKNYPFYICPRCASVRIKKRDMKKTVSFLKKQGEHISIANDLRFS